MYGGGGGQRQRQTDQSLSAEPSEGGRTADIIDLSWPLTDGRRPACEPRPNGLRAETKRSRRRPPGAARLRRLPPDHADAALLSSRRRDG